MGTGADKQIVTSGAQVAVVVPTCNAGPAWPHWIAALKAQEMQPARVMVVDSASADDTVAAAAAAGFEVIPIRRAAFDHGATRQWAVEQLAGIEMVCFLTQDALLARPDALQHLLAAFADPAVGAVYGRQLPRPGAGPIETHARLFNYPSVSAVRSLADREQFGLKTAFCSDSFAAYRVVALRQVGGFPSPVILGEDMMAAARLLLAGWNVAYQAEAEVFHSHAYTPGQEFRRYFDIGVFHAREGWLLEAFGGATGEGARYVQAELAYLWRERPGLILPALLRTACKFIGYRLGRVERWLPSGLKRRLSMNPGFWERGGAAD